MKKAFLILEDGTVFAGESIGADREVISEIVFNTSMTGYLEVLTDPSYAGQAVCMTYPLIGNYGICPADMESRKAWPDGYIVRELSRMPSNFRSEYGMEAFLLRQGIPGIAGIDTRMLVRILREKGTMNGMITTNPVWGTDQKDGAFQAVLPRLQAYTPAGVVKKVTRTKMETFRAADFGIHGISPNGMRIALMDYGTKNNIIRCLAKRGYTVDVFPAETPASVVLQSNPDGIMLSNGPGDPKECTTVIHELQTLVTCGVPIFAICLGHQLLALACGFDTVKMKYGHRGANHPVKDLATGKVYISSQNHGYMVKAESVDPARAVVSFRNVNDGTVEGLTFVNQNIFTVQFHPEACAGPQDSEFLFDRFDGMIRSAKTTGRDEQYAKR